MVKYTLTTVSHLLEVKFLKASETCSLVLVVLKSFEEVPSLFFTPSRRNPSVAVDDIVSLQTIYLDVKSLHVLFYGNQPAPM